jgi:ribosome maturation factor RimP
MDRSAVETKIQNIAQAAADEAGVEIVRVSIKGADKSPTVTVFIDKDGGVTHEDCASVSRQMDVALEADDFISTAYILEVSSPGLERELYSIKDFVKFTGSLAKVKLNKPINGQRSFRGNITAVNGEEITFDDRAGGEVKFPYHWVTKANLEIDLEAELSRGKEEKI